MWEALQPRARVGVDVAQRLAAPLVGRERELELLVAALARVREERSSQLVTLVGVPGIGKSRLVLELRTAVEREQEKELIGWRQGRSLPYGEGVTFWALGEIVKAQAGILESDSGEQAHAKLRRAVAELVSDEEERQWLDGHLQPLVGVGGEDGSARDGDPFAAWRRFLEALAEQGPFVLVFEDLHWADDALLDFVDELVDRVADVPLFVLATARPELLERRPGWGGGKTNAATISLSPLPDDASARLVAALLERPLLAADEQQALLAKIGGNPLYAEQYARALVEGGDLVELPETVQGIIAARLDALTQEEKRLLQDAAVVGKVFWVGALEAVGERAGSEMEGVLLRLERKQFVQRARRPSVAGESEYAFRHVLLRDVAYGQIPRCDRAEKHRRAAQWIESLGRAEDQAEMLADHYVNALEYTRASGETDPGLVERAVAALRNAGDRAAALAAYSAAVRFYEVALELSPSDPTLLLRLGRTRFSADSGGAEELEAAFEALRDSGDAEGAAEAALNLRMIAWYEGDGDRARRWMDEALQLVRARPDSPVKAMALVDRGSMHQVNQEFEEAIRVGQEALPLIDRLGLEVQRARVLGNIGTSRASMGDPKGLDDLEQSIEIARRAGEHARMHTSMNNLSEAQFGFGRIADAVATYEELVESMERFGRDTDQRWGRATLATIRAGEGRWNEALELADPFIAEVEAGSPHYLEPNARVARAFIRLARGDLTGASGDTGRALEAARAAGDAQLVAGALQARANVLLAKGMRNEATALVDEALALGAKLVPALNGFTRGLVEFAWLARALGTERRLLTLLESAPELPWVVAARAIASGDFERAATVLGQIGCPPDEAYVHLRAAQELVRAAGSNAPARHIEAALAFYRSVGATRFSAEAEALQESPATNRRRSPSTG